MKLSAAVRNTLGGLVAAGIFSASPLYAADVEIRLGHVLAESHSWHQAALGFAEQVATETDGRVEVSIFPSGQLGTETEVIEGLQFGSVQAAIIGSGSFQSIEPKLGIIEMPYAWSSREVAFEALDGEFGDTLAALLAEKGIVNLAWWENGYRNITNNRGPIETPADLAGLKIRVTPDPIRLATFEAFGAEPAPLAFGELYSALQQGVFDAQENPVSIILGSSFYEVQDYLSMSEHVWGAASLVLSKSVWDQISAEDQPIVKAAAEAWRDKQREMVGSAEAEIRVELEKNGMEINDVDKAAFIEAAQPIWEAQAETFGPELMSAIEAYRQ